MKCAIGQDSHRFDFSDNEKKLVIGGIEISNHPPLKANSDGDVVLHALTNAISGITGVNILGEIADNLCHIHQITDSKAYVLEALKYLKSSIVHVSFSIECKTPKLSPFIDSIKKSICDILKIEPTQIGITATSGEGLTEFGKGNGIQCFCIITVE